MSDKEYEEARKRALLAGMIGGGLGANVRTQSVVDGKVYDGHMGIAGPIAAGVTAPEGQRLRTGLYGLGGGFGGGIAGGVGSGLMHGMGIRSAAADRLLETAGAALGSGYGARAAIRKEASVSELSSIADLAQSGALGYEAQAAFEGMTSAINSYVEEEVPEKIASVEETDYTIYDENAARIARLNNLLRK